MNRELKDYLKALGVRFYVNKMVNIKYYDHGAESEIYTINFTENVLKISRNKSEYNAYQFLLSKNNDPDFKDFEIPFLAERYRKKFYFVFRKLDKIPVEYKKIMGSIEYFLQEINVENMVSLEDKKNQVIEYLNQKGYIEYEKFLNFLIDTQKILRKYNLTDVHSNNIMIDKEANFKIIDVQLDE